MRIKIFSQDKNLRQELEKSLTAIHKSFEYIDIDAGDHLGFISAEIIFWAVSSPESEVLSRIARFKSRFPKHAVIVGIREEMLSKTPQPIPHLIDAVVQLPPDPVFLSDIINHMEMALSTRNEIQALRNKIHFIEQEFDVFLKVGRAIASSLELNRVLTAIMNIMGRLLESEAWSVALIDPESDEIVFEAAVGEHGRDVLGVRLPKGKGIIGWVAEHGEPLIVADTTKDQRHYKGLDKNIGFKSRSILCLPLIAKGKILGAIEFINKLGSQFSWDDIEKIKVFVDLAAVSIENALLYRRAASLSQRDELTGLFNQRTLIEKLNEALQNAARTNSSLAYLFLDLDHFKQVNDKHGHLMGRQTLREVGRLLDSLCGSDAIIGRYGGDEFWVILSDASKEEGLALAEKIRAAIEKHTFLKEFDLDIHLTASVGVALYPEQALTFDDMAKMADEALFQAKQQNRNCVICALPNGNSQ